MSDPYAPNQGSTVGLDMNQFANAYTPQFNSPSGGGGPMGMLSGLMGGKKDEPGTTTAVSQNQVDNTGASIANQGDMTSQAQMSGNDAQFTNLMSLL
jgi:hypothetical protein